MQKTQTTVARTTSADPEQPAPNSVTLFGAWSDLFLGTRVSLLDNARSLGESLVVIAICIGLMCLCVALSQTLNPPSLSTGVPILDVTTRLGELRARLNRVFTPRTQLTLAIVNATGADLKLRVMADADEYDKLVQAGHEDQVTLAVRPANLSYLVEPLCGDGIIRESRMDSSTSVSKFVDKVALPANKFLLRIRNLSAEPILKVRVNDIDCAISISPDSTPHIVGIYTVHSFASVQVYVESGTKAYSALRYKTDPRDGTKFIDLVVR